MIKLAFEENICPKNLEHFFQENIVHTPVKKTKLNCGYVSTFKTNMLDMLKGSRLFITSCVPFAFKTTFNLRNSLIVF